MNLLEALDRRHGVGIPEPGEDPEFDGAFVEACKQEDQNSEYYGSDPCTWRAFLKSIGRCLGPRNVSATKQFSLDSKIRYGTRSLLYRLMHQQYLDDSKEPPGRTIRVCGVSIIHQVPRESVYHASRRTMTFWLGWLSGVLKALRRHDFEAIRDAARAIRNQSRSLSLAVLALLATLLGVESPDVDAMTWGLPLPRILAPGGQTALFPPLC